MDVVIGERYAWDHWEPFGLSVADRWQHVLAVARLASQVAPALAGAAPTETLTAAAYLHDIGYAPEIATTGFHPLDGAIYLQGLSAQANVVALVAHHTGAAYEAAERGLSGALAALPAPNPTDLEELNLLDLVIGPSGSPTSPSSRLSEVLKRYAANDPVHRAVAVSRPVLLAGAERARRRLCLTDEWPLSVTEGVFEA